MRFAGVLPLLPVLLAAAPAHAQAASSISVSVFSALSSQPASASATAAGSSSSSSSNSSSASSAAAAPQQTPGFVNNGTVGMYPCAGGNADSVSTPRSNRTDAAAAAAPANSTGGAVASAASANASASSQMVMDSSSSSRLYALGLDYGSCPEAQAPAYPTLPIHLRAPDDSLRATFSPYGAGITELWVRDRSGSFRDVVLGFDNITNYLTDPLHPNFGPIVGRYANRIANGTYQIDGTTYHAPLNENNVSTLHGGDIGYDRSPFEVVSINASAVTFALTDPDGNQGFPGTVRSHISYALREGGVWSIAMNATVTEKKSPVMLSSHVYWNLDGYKRADNETTILDHVLHLPQADKYIETDSLLIPRGPTPSVENTPFDFRTARPLSERYNETKGVCGPDCQGWDSCWVQSEPDSAKPAIELYSPQSGIKVSVTSDQPAIQVYTCSGVSSPTKGSLPRKRTHGGDGTLAQIYENHSCIVLEMEEWIDGINHPEWNRTQIYEPNGQPYIWNADYTFSNVDESGNAIAANSTSTQASSSATATASVSSAVSSAAAASATVTSA